ncbi:DeoR/GlpR family DNA-binding transcription regulator [Humibacter albus]|uniref:DeoR/GlpR family DNA-binding transcription regulator n=1 Tax=Humibacter albus TaxID=427754 RepID=UPI0003B39326|nr:DeoR/GlpR family DNA-binding transcription regulator [Humibacter albus]
MSGSPDSGVPDSGAPATIRRRRMLSLIGERGFVRVGELSETFGVSDVTVRSDLDVLEGTQGIRRVHGGAMPRVTGPLHELSFEEALESLAEEKRAIARRAAALVEPGMSVIVDVGSTCMALARELVRREDLYDVTVITNGLTIALELENAVPRLQVIVTGGTLRPLQHSLVAPLATVMFEHVHADLAFIGCNGVDAVGGVTNINLPEAELKRDMVRASARAVVLADGSKAGAVHLGRIGTLSDFESVYLGASADAASLSALRGTGATVLAVEADSA